MYACLLDHHSQPFAALSNLSLSLNDPRVIKFLSQYSWSAEPSAQSTLQLLGYMAGVCVRERAGARAYMRAYA